jgi:hypothetical protein
LKVYTKPFEITICVNPLEYLNKIGGALVHNAIAFLIIKFKGTVKSAKHGKLAERLNAPDC